MAPHPESRPYDTINVTPMLDLAYVLLVIFILITTATLRGLEISLPKTARERLPNQPPPHVVQVRRDGQIAFDGTGMSLSELEAALARMQARESDPLVLIKGDAGGRYAQVVAVIDACDRLRIDMSLVTARLGT